MIMLHVYRNGVCGRCGKTDDGVRPQACSGRSRADASARARRAAQTLIEEIGADGPVSVEEVAQKAVQEFRALRLQLVEARAALEESEHSMHLRIRAGYDRTVADSWRKKVAEVETERDEARAEVEMLRGVGCREAKAGEPESGPCGVCLRCAEERGAQWALRAMPRLRDIFRNVPKAARDVCVEARKGTGR
jgi:hypothetical protein